jgi:predicted Zn-dependent protease
LHKIQQIETREVYNMFMRTILTITLLIISFHTSAETMVRDSEMENIIIEAINPIVKVSGATGKINLFFIQSQEINAFTPGANDIFLYTGLISKFHDVNMIKGVVAHELGHIVAHHNSRMTSNIETQQKAALGGVAIGLAAALASGNPGVLLAGAIGGSDYAATNILKYSRAFESSADQAAFQSLEKSGNSTIGMKKMFDFFIKEQRGGHPDPYSLTHPLSTERMNALNNFMSHAKYQHSTSSKSLDARYERMSYKILAFTETPEDALREAKNVKNNAIALYMKAVAYMRMGNINQALASIDPLLKSAPEDPYYNELKGQILFEFGKPESLRYFLKASSLLPNDALMKMNVAVVALNVHQKHPDKLSAFIPYLKFVQNKDPKSPEPYYYLSLYYEAMNQEALRQVYLALYYDKQGDKRGVALAKSALRILMKDTPEWYWAQDIVEREKE